jgi:phospholipase C
MLCQSTGNVRRPKIAAQENCIWGKINSELFKFAEAARAVGIPCIAAFPAVATLYDLYCVFSSERPPIPAPARPLIPATKWPAVLEHAAIPA